ncbi:MAG TPA: type VI secretion system protein TssA [Planctomycetota bacterium]|nr:type VI secretion system protein TssA [Planctomycetota bacterium]
MSLDALATIGTEPIPGAAPCGESVRYDPDFEALSNEIEKLTAVEQVPVDWNRVVQLGGALLAKGKDLLVASYLTCGLLERGGYAGLATGCGVLRGLFDNFWDGLFPELRRMRARIAALDWLAARLEKVLPLRGDPGEADRQPLEAAIADLDTMLADANGRFEGEGPTLGPALRALRGKLDAIPRPAEPEPEPPAADSAPAASTRAPEPPPPPPPEPDPVDPEAVAKALAGMREKQIEYAAVLRLADDSDPRAYLLLREALWSDVAVPTGEGGEPPRSGVGDKSVLAPLEAGLDGGEYAQVLREAEELLPEHPLWLDLQLVAVNAMDGLGRRHARARHAVLESLAFLLRRCPTLAEASNGEGQPLAAKATRVWLANEVVPAAGGQAEQASVGSEARKLVARGKLGEAMRLMTGRIDATASRRGRFVLRLDLARLCIEAGRLDLAVPQLEQLDKEVTHFSLEEWEPDLATEVVRSLWQCCAGPKPAPSLAARGQDIYARLCRLDPAAAVSAIGPQGE